MRVGEEAPDQARQLLQPAQGADRDHDTAPLTVASLAPVHHGRLQLVYLSACRTAFTSAAELLDEATHLTSAFQLAGSRLVIGTLWEIGDASATDVAAAFYRELRAGLAPSTPTLLPSRFVTRCAPSATPIPRPYPNGRHTFMLARRIGRADLPANCATVAIERNAWTDSPGGVPHLFALASAAD